MRTWRNGSDESRLLPESVTYVEKTSVIPGGYTGLAKHIRAIWKPLSEEEALMADSFAKRVRVQSVEDLWQKIPRSKCIKYGHRNLKITVLDEDGDNTELYLEQILEFKVPVMSMEDAVDSELKAVLVNSGLRNASQGDPEAVEFGKSVIVTKGKLVRELLVDWCEVIIDTRRQKNYKKRAAEREEEERKKHQIALEEDRAGQRRSNIVRSVTTTLNHLEQITRALGEERVMKSLPYGTHVSFCNVQAEALSKKIFGVTESALICRRMHRILCKGDRSRKRNFQEVLEALYNMKCLRLKRGELKTVLLAIGGSRANYHKRYTQHKKTLSALWAKRSLIWDEKQLAQKEKDLKNG